MHDRPRRSGLLVMIAVTCVIAAAAFGSTGAISNSSGATGKDCLPAVTGRHYTVSLDLRCAREPEKPAARPTRQAVS